MVLRKIAEGASSTIFLSREKVDSQIVAEINMPP
jgi:hypothetical protein